MSVLSLAAVRSGNSLLFVILAALLSAVIVSGIAARHSLRHVLLSLQLPENVFEGERVAVKVTIKNLKWMFPSFSIRVEDSDLNRERWSRRFYRKLSFSAKRETPDPAANDRAIFRQAAYFPMLRAGESRSELTVQSFPHRGLYTMKSFWISTRFPFGFFQRGEHIGAKGEILVYPLIREISSYFHLLPFFPGAVESRHAGQGENLFAMRKHLESESARAIDWKATAKTGELMAREFAREEENRVCLVLDTRVASGRFPGIGGTFEKAVSLAASIAAHFLNKGSEIEFLTPGEYIPCGTGIDHLYRILRSLAVVQAERIPAGAEQGLGSSESLTAGHPEAARSYLSDKIFKIIISSRPKGSFPSLVWRSSHVVYFDEL